MNEQEFLTKYSSQTTQTDGLSASDFLAKYKPKEDQGGGVVSSVANFLAKYMPAEAEMRDDTEMRQAKGALTTSFIAAPVAALGGVVSSPFRGSVTKPQEEIASALTYEPESVGSREIAADAGKALSYPFEKVAEGVGAAYEAPSATPEEMTPTGEAGTLEQNPLLRHTRPFVETAAIAGSMGIRPKLSADMFIKKYKTEPKTDLVAPISKNEALASVSKKEAEIEAAAVDKKLPAGPGAKLSGTTETPSDLVQLTQSLEGVESPKLPLPKRIANATRLSETVSTAKDTLSRGLDRLTAVGETLYDDVKTGDIGKPKTYADFDKIRDEYIGAYQQSNFEARKFGAEIRKQISDSKRREAITNYIQADGDMDLLKKQAEQSMANPKTKRFAEGYEAAMELTESEKNYAETQKNYFESKLAKGIEADLLEHGLDDYVNMIFEKDSPIKRKLQSDIAGGRLSTNPSFVKKRLNEDYFMAEQQGNIPKSKDIGFLATVYDQTFNRAIAARNFIKKLHDANGSDGKPLVGVSGAAKQIEGAVDEKSPYLIKPRAKGEELADHKIIDHPALRKWKWVGADENGNPIMMQGDLIVHPEVYDKLNNMLKTSAVRKSVVGKAALTGVANLKGTLLSMSGFHQVQVGIHAVWHGVNPFHAPKIDFFNPFQKALVDHGTIVADYKNMELFYEGMSSGGLIGKLPGIGPLMMKYTDYLFTDYIPRIKMKMAQEAYRRNTKRYEGKLSNDQILSLTSDQANAAFGELNYAKLGRNPTTQDVLRLMLLAPDFLEARARFVAQSVRPYAGVKELLKSPTMNEQGMAAILRGGLGLYAGCRIVNAILNDGNTYSDKPFSVIIKGYEFVPRTVTGDVFHLINDPTSFAYHRLNPVTVTPIAKAALKRDEFGRYMDGQQLVTDYFKSFIPIPLQGWSKGESKVWQSLMASMGISSFKYKTNFERALAQENSKHIAVTSTRDDRERYQLVSKYANNAHEAIMDSDYDKLIEIQGKVNQDIADGKLYAEDADKFTQYVTEDRVEKYLKSLPAEQVLGIWSKATPDEQMKYKPIIEQKIENLKDKHPERYEKLLPQAMKKLYGM